MPPLPAGHQTLQAAASDSGLFQWFGQRTDKISRNSHCHPLGSDGILLILFGRVSPKGAVSLSVNLVQ